MTLLALDGFIQIPNMIWWVVVLCVQFFQVKMKVIACLTSYNFFLKKFEPFIKMYVDFWMTSCELVPTTTS